MNLDGLDRLDLIKSRVDSDGRVRVSELAGELNVSEMTIRRDLEILADRGVLQRVRGGASALDPQPLANRFGQHARGKERIAKKLAPLIRDSPTLGIDASTTLLRLPSVIEAAREMTIITNSPDLFSALQDKPGVTALITGGQLDRRTGSLIGPLAIRSTKDLLLRRLVVSAAGIDAEHGTTEVTLEEADVKLAFAQAATEVIVAVDHSKLGQRGSARCLGLDRIDILVTDLDPDDDRLKTYRERVQVI